MATWGDKSKQGLEKWFTQPPTPDQPTWSDRIKDWMSSWLAWGLELIFDTIGKGLGNRLDTLIDAFAEEYKIPPETVVKIKETWKGEGQWQMVLGSAAGGTAVGSLIGSTIGPWLKLVEYIGLKIAKPFRLDPGSVITAWRRDPKKYAALFDDLKDQGWDDEKIETLKFFTLFLPTADEQTTWLAREVYEPEMITKYGLDDEMPVYEETDFSKVGVSPEQMANKWRAHWIHASWMQVVEMLRRGQLTVEDVRRWFRVVEIPPYWRDKLINISYEVPTRVDVRRWWDMRTITEERLREVYAWQGYHGKDLDDYVLWTKVYVAFPDLTARWKNGWITEDDVRNELIGLGMPSERVEEMIQTKIKPVQPERVTSERNLTKTDVYKAIKKGLMSVSDGTEILMDLGFSEDEAVLLIETNVGALEGSPETYLEFKRLTQLYRKAMGLEAKMPPQELLVAEKALVAARIALRDAESENKKEEKLAPYLKMVNDAEYRYRQLLARWKEA